MKNYGGIISFITIIALVTAIFFVFGVHQIKDHFCPINNTNGICGFLGSLAQIVDHVFSLNIFLILFLPVAVSFLLGIFFMNLLDEKNLPVLIENYYLKHLSHPKVRSQEFSWLRFHINSPTL